MRCTSMCARKVGTDVASKSERPYLRLIASHGKRKLAVKTYKKKPLISKKRHRSRQDPVSE
jgi:hypothetical protein